MLAWAALLPVLVVLGGLFLGISSLRAAWMGLALALGLAAWGGWAGAYALPDAPALQAAALHWLPVVLEVVCIIGGGLALSHLLQASGAQAALADWLRQRAGSGVAAVLLVVHGATPFAESVTGFGIGVTVGIPLLLHFGLSPARAALVGLLGLCTVPWGSMGPGTLIAARMAGVPVDALGVSSAWLSLPPFIVAGWVAAWLASGPGQRWQALGLASVSAQVLWLAVLLANSLAGTPPAGALGALAVMGFHLAFRPGAWPAWPPLAKPALQAYAIVLGGLLLGRYGLHVGGWRGGAGAVLASPAWWLWMAIGFVLWRTGGHGWRQTARARLARAVQGWGNVALVAVLYIALGLVLSLSGMAARLAQALASLGGGYALLAPFVGALGGFVTGSNTGANAMLADTQARMALQIGAPLLPFMATHNVSAALLLMASPAKVEMAVRLCPLQAAQQRAWVQRMVLLAALPSVLAMAAHNAMMLWGG
ncbi:L-lactate permease [Allofranklinella schreckenbergeri]|uniref:L-lactate permease n=1 Tax=Allofranklinella schreckenbergeri TaxID=1076744 RepID=A0A3M6R158_9BURK|nr:L-lactate permease [Allofranklinella schreckenbergeri]RMX08988.1 L-lactate permease [Allofranklinella schreckenbergeri]